MARNSPYNTHQVALGMIRPNSMILDVGCGPGIFASMVKTLGCHVVGLDLSTADVASMVDAGFEAEVVDLEDSNALDILDGRTFDQIVTLDVLEHLRFPGQVLTSLCKHLRPGGELIVSIPNVTHLDVRLALVKGTFPYADDGLLDRTHLRFFDWPGVQELLDGSDLHVLERIEIHRDGSTGPSGDGLRDDLISAVSIAGDATVQQWVMLVSPDVHDVLPTPTGVFLRDSIKRAAVIEGSTDYARDLEGKISWLEDELEDARLLEREVNFQREVLEKISDDASRSHTRIGELEAAVAAEQLRAVQSETELHATRSRASYRLVDRFVSGVSKRPNLYRLLQVAGSPFVAALRQKSE